MSVQECPFCGSAITGNQLSKMREKIRMGQDPAILQEIETIRSSIREEEKTKAKIEIDALRSKVDSYKKRDLELEKRAAELKAREVTIEDEIKKRTADRVTSIRAEVTTELTRQHRSDLARRDQQLVQLKRDLATQKELSEQEIQRQVNEREEQIRQDEKSRQQAFLEPLRNKLTEYQQKEASLLKKEETLKIREHDVELAVERGMQEKEVKIREQERSHVEKLYEPLRAKIDEYREKEGEFLRKEQSLSLREQEVELRVARGIAEKRDEILRAAQKQEEDKHGIKIKEHEHVIAELRQQLEEAQQLIQTGSPQRRGLVQEEELADQLQRLFGEDDIERIASGIRGADVLQAVMDSSVGKGGSIYWESKRTKDFQPNWIPKLKKDQQDRKADIGAIVTTALPDEAEDFSIMEGIVVIHPRLLAPVASLMRQYLLNIARQRLTLEQRDSKISSLFRYMTGNDFHQRVAAIVDAHAQLSELNDRERRAHEKVWATRDQLQLDIGRNIARGYLINTFNPLEG